MKIKQLLLILLASGAGLVACSHSSDSSSEKSKNTIVVDKGEDARTIDSALDQDSTSTRIVFDLFSGLTSFDQSNKTIPGLAEKWDVSPDGKTYTFHLRSGLKFSDGSPITAEDVVFSWQRIADPKVGSPYNMLASNIVNGQAIIDSKMPATQLGIKALDPQTIEISLNHPDASFLQICAMPNTAVVSKANLQKFGQAWTDPKNMVNSGAYIVKEWVIKGHMSLVKNPNYYDASNVSVTNITVLPIVDANASLNQYQAKQVDITDRIPIDQYKEINQQFTTQAHTVTQEGLYYYDLNMTLPKFKSSPQLRQALSMAVDRQALVKDVLGQKQVPAYSLVTSTIEGGKFAGLDYDWAKWPRAQQIAKAQELFKAAGYDANHPLQITISYNTMDSHKKIALAIASMWQQVFGAKSIQVSQGNQEWKTFLKARNMANYDVARDGWIADYDSVDSYTNLYQCGNPQDNAKYCNQQYNQLITQAQNSTDPVQRVNLIKQAIQIAQNDYPVIPLYQYTYYRLVDPRVKGYTPETNHLDHVQSKWYKLN